MAGENINRRLHIYINDKEVVNSMSGITREMAKTRNELKHLNKNADDYDDEVKRLTKHLEDLTEKQDEFKSELKLTNKEMGAARENFSNIFSGLATGDMKAVQTGFLAIRGSIVASTQAAWAFIATPIGAFIALFAGLGLAAKQVVDFNESIRESNELLDNLGVDTKVRPTIQALVDTYKVGFEDLANAIDNMVDLGLVKDEFEALNQIKEGLVKAPDKNGFLSMLNENGIAAKNLGLTLQDVIDLNESFEKTGANAQAIFGALQKSSSTLTLQSPQLKKSLENAFGASFTSDLLTQVRTGAITYYEALDKIYKKGEELGISNQKQAQLAKDLFGKSSIAAGGYQMILSNVTDAQGKQTKALTETQKEVKALAESQIELAEAQERALKVDGYNRWKNKALMALNSVSKAWYDLVYLISTSEEERAENAKKDAASKIAAQNRKNDIADFKSYIEEKRKELGKSFDFEKVAYEKIEETKREIELFADEKSKKVMRERLKNYKSYFDEITKINTKKSVDDGQTEEEKKAAADAAKKRAKELEDAKNHSDDLLKQLEASKKELLATERSFEDLKLSNQKESYAKELALLNEEYDRKIEDSKIKISELQSEIQKLNIDAKDPKNSKSDVETIKAIIANKIAAQKDYNDTIVALEQTRSIKIATLQEKYLNEDFKKQDDAFQRNLKLLQTKHNNELAALKTLEQAKAILADTMSADELKKVATLEEAKKLIKEKQLQEEFELQKKYLFEITEKYKSLLTLDTTFHFLSDEEKDKILKNIDDIAFKLSELTLKSATPENPLGTKQEGLKSLSGLDILGFTPEDWDKVFQPMDSFSAKLEATKVIVGGLTNAFGMYFQALDAGEQRSLQKFEATTNKKKAALTNQLEKGYITQEVYNSRVAKLDQDLARKKAEIEYKQAKRQRVMQASQIISSTALAIMGIWAQVPKFDFGISAGVLTGVVAGLGAAQLGLLLAQPLPEKGFMIGGFTGNGSKTDVAGLVHKNEYVIPEDVLFSNDPVVPNVVSYLEAKRKGNVPESQNESASSSGSTTASTSGNSSLNAENTKALNRISAILEKIEKDGLIAYLENNIKNARKMRDKIKEVNNLETNAKL